MLERLKWIGLSHFINESWLFWPWLSSWRVSLDIYADRAQVEKLKSATGVGEVRDEFHGVARSGNARNPFRVDGRSGTPTQGNGPGRTGHRQPSVTLGWYAKHRWCFQFESPHGPSRTGRSPTGYGTDSVERVPSSATLRR